MSMGMSFNGAHSSTFNLSCSPRIPLLPEKRKATIEIPGLDGTYDFNNDSYAPRIIPVDCMIKAADRAALRLLLAQIAVWLSGSGWLIFDHDTGKQWDAKVYSGIDLSKAPLAAQFTISYEAQPYAEDVNATVGTIGTVQDYGSLVPFFPVITVVMTGSAASVQVTHLASGKFIKITDSLVNGNVLVFDMSTGKVTKNGVSCMTKLSIDSLKFCVPPGSQTITVATNGTCTASISYRKRYLYA